MARKYRVLAGSHIQDGREFKKDEVVTSEQDLSKMFIGKFAEVGPAGEPVLAAQAPAAPPAPAAPAPAPAKPKRQRSPRWD